MKEHTKLRRHDEKLAALLGLTVEEVQAQREAEEQDDKSREVQAIHLFLEKPDAFMLRNCKNCNGTFLTTYQFVSYCSNRCRIKSLTEIGIDWNPYHTPEERWRRTRIPVEYSIPPEALSVLLEIAHHNKPTDNYASQTTQIPSSQSENHQRLYSNEALNDEPLPLISTRPEIRD